MKLDGRNEKRKIVSGGAGGDGGLGDLPGVDEMGHTAMSGDVE